MEKLDLKSQYKSFYAPSAKAVAEVTVPAWQFLMVDGAGDPNTAPRFPQAVEALYALSYTLKFMVREACAVDYGVMPLEGLWWMPDMAAFDIRAKDQWLFTVMILQPEYVTPALLARARAQVAKKKNLPALADVRLETFAEGHAAQILHVGPFAEEGPTVEKLHRHIAVAGARPVGKHHEIYLTNISRTAPERWKTVLRQPMAR